MKNRYYQKLNLDFEVDTTHLNILKTQLADPLKKETFIVGPSFADENLKRVAKDCNSTIINTAYFYTPPGNSRVIHSDNTKLDNITKINFVINGHGSVMKWWQLKDQAIKPNTGTLPNGNKYIYYTADQCELVAEAEIIEPTMVNVGALHSVENFTYNYRWAISFLLGDENQKSLQWDEAVMRFAKYFAK